MEGRWSEFFWKEREREIMRSFILVNICLASALALDKAHHSMSLRKHHRQHEDPDATMTPMQETVAEGTSSVSSLSGGDVFFFSNNTHHSTYTYTNKINTHTHTHTYTHSRGSKSWTYRCRQELLRVRSRQDQQTRSSILGWGRFGWKRMLQWGQSWYVGWMWEEAWWIYG